MLSWHFQSGKFLQYIIRVHIQIFPVWAAMLLFGCCTLLQIFRGTYFELVVVETQELPLLSTLFIIVLDIGSSCCRVAGSCRVDAVASMVCKDESVHGSSKVVVSSWT